MRVSIAGGVDDAADGPVRRRRALVMRIARLAIVPSGRDRVTATPMSSVAGTLVAAGLFTVSWERFANLSAAGYNVKLPVVLFSIAAILAVPGWWRWLRGIRKRPVSVRWIVLLASAVVLVFVIRALTALPLSPGIAQIIAVGTGAVAPALAIVGLDWGAGDVVWALRWFVAGAVVSSVFGFYQLFAFYAGLPQGIDYTGVGTSGEGGRISAFNYEPAYFAYFIVLAIGAVVAIARLEGRRVSWVAIVFFALVLVLVNVRALLFLLPVFAVLLAVQWRRNRALILRGAVAGAVLIAVVALVPMAMSAMQTWTKAVPATSARATTPARDTSPSAESSSTGSVSPHPEAAAPQLPTDVLDPNEPSSNGPRIDLYKAVGQVDLQHPIVGVGPGHLRAALEENRFVASNQRGASVVANNIWLQAVADGGAILLLLEGALVSALAVLWWRSRDTAAHPVTSAVLALLLVGGLLTSYFFDIKVWVMLAFAIVLASTAAQADESPESASA